MLDLGRVDLSLLAEALEDHSELGSWWIDPATGEIQEWSSDAIRDEGDDQSPAERGWRRIEPLSSRESYADMAEFAERVRDRRARDLLRRAIAGRGAFRRFKDTLVELPALRTSWFTFHDTRMRRRAIAWLAAEGLLAGDDAARAVAAHEDPELAGLGWPFDADETARSVARDLKERYGPRLRRVVLFGSHARGEADEESDLDLAVVLDRVPDPWAELRVMDDVLWEHTLTTGVVISAIPVGERDLEAAVAPALAHARDEGRTVG